MTRFAKTVTIVHRRDQLRAQKVLQDRAFANEKVSFIWDSVVKEIKGENRVESVVFENVKTGQVDRASLRWRLYLCWIWTLLAILLKN